MNIEVDLSIADLEERYGVNRANVYKRVNVLKEKGYALEFETRDRKSYANPDQVLLMDALHNHIKAGRSMDSFPAFGETNQSESLVRHSEPSRKTQDRNGTLQPSSQVIPIDALAPLLSAIALPRAAPPDRFENLKQIDEAYRQGWHLSTSQLAPLLSRKSLAGRSFKMFGYTFTAAGRNGRETAWKIDKA